MKADFSSTSATKPAFSDPQSTSSCRIWEFFPFACTKRSYLIRDFHSFPQNGISDCHEPDCLAFILFLISFIAFILKIMLSFLFLPQFFSNLPHICISALYLSLSSVFHEKSMNIGCKHSSTDCEIFFS